MNSIFLSPHNDDETLFGAFTLLRERPRVIVIFDGFAQGGRGIPITFQQRRFETKAACQILGCPPPQFACFRDDDPTVTPNHIRSRVGQMIDRLAGKEIYAPAMEAGGHKQHNMVAEAFGLVPGVKRYLTYTDRGKSVRPNEVPILQPEWIGLKLKALAVYNSQFDPRTGCAEHFIGRSLREYML